MAKVHHFIRKELLDSYGFCPVYIQITHGGERWRYPVKEKIRPKDIAKSLYKKEKRLRHSGLEERDYQFNDRLEKIEKFTWDIIRNFEIRRVPYTLDQITVPVLEYLNPVKVSEGWEAVFDSYLKHCEVKGNSQGTMKGKKSTKQCFIDYLKKDINLIQFTAAVLDDWIDWMLDEKKFEPSYIKKKLSQFKDFLKYCHDTGKPLVEGILLYVPRRKLKVKVPDAIFLTHDEFLQLYNYKAETESEERLKDAFLILCTTALRHSDSALVRADVKGDTIVKRMQKTDTNAVIPVSGILRELLEKYDYSPPRFESQYLSDEIKKIARKAKITTQIKIIKYPGGVKTETIVEKCDVLSTKVGRKTLVSTLIAYNVPENVIRKITGHSKSINMEPYIGIRDNQIMESVKDPFKIPDK